MAEIKWIKITTSMFDDEKIKLIDSMPERDTIFNIWIKLLVQAGKCNSNGFIFLTENVPYTEEMLATIFNRPLNSIRLALQILKNFKMIEIDEQNLIKISNWEKHQNVKEMDKIREQTRKRVAKHRAKKKKLLETSKDEICGDNDQKKDVTLHVTLPNATEEEEDIERDIERDIEEDEDVEEKDMGKNKSSSSTTTKNFSDVIDIFNNNIHMVTPLEYEKLEDWTKDMTCEVVIKAIEESVYYNKRSMGYINAILNNWLNNNLKNIQAVEGYLRDRADKKGVKSNGTSKRDIKEPEDEGLGFIV